MTLRPSEVIEQCPGMKGANAGSIGDRASEFCEDFAVPLDSPPIGYATLLFFIRATIAGLPSSRAAAIKTRETSQKRGVIKTEENLVWMVHASNLLTSFELPGRGDIKTERDLSTNCCSAWRSGVNRELSVNQLKSFPHACKAKPVPTHCLGIKSSTCVMHSQLDLIQCAFERHLESLHTAMLHGIPEGFLQNPEEAECHLFGQLFRYIVGIKSNFDIVSI